MAESAMEKRMPALWQRAIGKMLAGRGAVAEILLPGRAIGKMLLAGAPQWQRYYWPGALRQSCWQAAAERHYGTKKESDP